MGMYIPNMKPEQFYDLCKEHGLEIIAVPVPTHGRVIDADEFKKIVANAKHMDAGIFDGKTMYSDHLCIGADYDDVCAAIDETPTIIPACEEVYGKYVDTAGNLRWTGTYSGEHVIPAEKAEEGEA